MSPILNPHDRKLTLHELLADEEKLIADYEKKIKAREKRREERRLVEEAEANASIVPEPTTPIKDT